MARISPSDIEHKIINRLWSETREYFESHWNREWRVHGSAFNGFENIHNKNSFFEDIKEKIDQKLIEKYGLASAAGKSISIDSIRRFLLRTKDNFDDKVLEAFLLLTGSKLTWNEYKIAIVASVKPEQQAYFSAKSRWVGVVILLIMGLVATGLYLRRLQKASEIHFSAVLTESIGGLPKVKIFYDLQKAEYKVASIFFDQHRINLTSPAGDTLVSSSLPKRSQVRLYHDDKPVKTIDILIPSQGWVGSINNRVPLKAETFLKNGMMHCPPSDKIKEMYGPEYYTSFMNFREFKINGDSFLLEAEVMNSPGTGGIWAYDVSVDIVGTRDNIVFNLLNPDASMYARLVVARTNFEEGDKARYLPRLAVDLSRWRHLKVATHNRKFQIILDDEILVESDYSGEIGEIQGLQFYMKGSGAVRNVRLQPYGHPENVLKL